MIGLVIVIAAFLLTWVWLIIKMVECNALKAQIAAMCSQVSGETK